MSHHRPLLYAFALAITVLGGCVNTNVSSRKVGSDNTRLERVVFAIQTPTFAAANLAANLGQKNFDALVPNLKVRLPIVFALNGLPARTTQITGSLDQNSNTVNLQPGALLSG
jgi:anaerobic glycerol-3-phosphate dehydrogenase